MCVVAHAALGVASTSLSLVLGAQHGLVDHTQAIVGAVNTILDWWDVHDLLVTPTTFQPAWPLGTPVGPALMGTLQQAADWTQRRPALGS